MSKAQQPRKTKQQLEQEQAEFDRLNQIKVYEGIINNQHAAAISDSVQDLIIGKVAAQMWEKEVITKNLHPFASQYSTQFADRLVSAKQDPREDDVHLTPRRDDETTYDYEFSADDDGRREIETLVDKPEPPDEAQMANIDVFPNAYQNPASKFVFRQYEENEAPPPNLDHHAYDRVRGHGQFLLKNYKPTPEEEERMKNLEELNLWKSHTFKKLQNARATLVKQSTRKAEFLSVKSSSAEDIQAQVKLRNRKTSLVSRESVVLPPTKTSLKLKAGSTESRGSRKQSASTRKKGKANKDLAFGAHDPAQVPLDEYYASLEKERKMKEFNAQRAKKWGRLHDNADTDEGDHSSLLGSPADGNFPGSHPSQNSEYEREQGLVGHIDYLRQRKEVESEMKKRIEMKNKNQKRKNLMNMQQALKEDVMNDEAKQRAFQQAVDHYASKQSVNVTKLPKFEYPSHMDGVPSKDVKITKYRYDKKGRKIILNLNKIDTQSRRGDTMLERPPSSKSALTQLTGPTVAPTQMTQNTYSSQANAAVIDKNARLVDHIFDSHLGREQVQEMGKDSSLSSADAFTMKGGVRFQQFARTQEQIMKNKAGEKDAAATHDAYGNEIQEEKPKTFEERMALRAKQDAGIERRVICERTGGVYAKEGCWSLKQYDKNKKAQAQAASMAVPTQIAEQQRQKSREFKTFISIRNQVSEKPSARTPSSGTGAPQDNHMDQLRAPGADSLTAPKQKATKRTLSSNPNNKPPQAGKDLSKNSDRSRHMLISERSNRSKSREQNPIKIYSPDGSHAQNWATSKDAGLHTIGHEPADYYKFGGLASQSTSNLYNTASGGFDGTASAPALHQKNLKYLKQNHIINHNSAQSNVRQLFTGNAPRKQTVQSIYQMDKQMQIEKSYSEVDILRSTLYTSQPATAGVGSRYNIYPNRQIPMMRNATAASKNAYSRNQTRSVAAAYAATNPTTLLRYQRNTQMSFYSGHTSSLKNVGKESKVKPFVQSHYPGQFDPKADDSIFDDFNKKLATKQNPKPLIERRGKGQNQLTQQARLNIIEHSNKVNDLLVNTQINCTDSLQTSAFKTQESTEQNATQYHTLQKDIKLLQQVQTVNRTQLKGKLTNAHQFINKQASKLGNNY